ncbi:MAG: protein kinase [Myxococcaceae bacterium]|nr:protein kinase [Myxococcaceae bacterium]
MRCAVIFATLAELQAAVGPRLERGELFVPHPDAVPAGTAAFVDVMLERGARAALDGIVKGQDFDDRGNTGLLVTLSEESALALQGFLAALSASVTDSNPSAVFASTQVSSRKAHQPAEPEAGARESGEKLLEPGTLLEERFRIESHIASGGMGDVYRATHVHLKRTVALKLLKRALAADPEMWERFKREAELVSQLENPHVVRVFDFGRTAAGQPYLAMEFVEGTPLDAVVARGPLAPDRTVTILRQVCEGLADAHHLGIVHRDLKPANIVLSKRRDGSESAKILDFGIARATQKGEGQGGRLTRMGMVVGTPLYLAPEQALADTIDERTDIYALGCVAYELLTGGLPFVAPDLARVISMHLTQAPDDPASRWQPLARYPRLCQAVLKALAKSRSDRFANVAELSKALADGLAADQAPPANLSAPTPPPPPAGDEPWAQQRPTVGRTSSPGSPRGHLTAGDASFASLHTPPSSLANGRGPAADRRARFEASRLPLSSRVFDDLASSRELFRVAGDRLLVVHVEVAGPPPGSANAQRSLARALMVARGWGLVVEAIDDATPSAVLLLSGTAVETSARVALALLAMREAVAEEGARGPAEGHCALRAAVVEVSTRTELERPLDLRLIHKARQLTATATGDALYLEAPLAEGLEDLVEARPVEGPGFIALLGRRSRMAESVPGLVGRDALLQGLDKRVESLSAGVVAPLIVRAPRGSGRSTLAAELARRARARGVIVGVGSAAPSLRGAPFGALTDLLCGLTGVATEARQFELPAALEKLGLVDTTRTAALALTGVVQLPHPFTAGQAVQALRAVVRAGANGRPVLTLFDAVETFDGPSLDAVRELLMRPAPKELTIAFADPEVSLERLGSAPSVDVAPLTRADVAQWLTTALKAPPSAQLVETIFSLSSGLPDRMVDLAWWLHDRGCLRRRGDETVLVGEVPPFDVDGLKRARLSAMPLAGLRLLEAAAVCGDTFDGPTLTLVLPHVTPQALQLAVKTRLVQGLPNRRWAFTSRTLQQLVASAGSPERALMNQRLAAHLVEKARVAPASVDHLKLGRYLNAAGDGVRAAALWKYAVEVALGNRALRDTIQGLRGWADALGQTTPPQAAVTRARIDMLARAAGIAMSLQDAVLARALVDEAVALLQGRQLDSPELALSLARVHRSEARGARAVEALTSASALGAGTAVLALVEAERAEALELDKDLPGAMLAWEACLSLAPGAEEFARWHGEVSLTARVEARLAGVKLLRKDTAGARLLLESSLARWREARWPSAEARVLANLGTVCVHGNQLAEASKHFEAAAVAAASSGDLLFEAKMLLQQARVEKKLGEALASRRLATKVRGLAAELGWDEGRQQAEQL